MIDVHVEGVLAQHLGEEETGERQLDQHVLVQRLEQLKKRFILFQVQNESYFFANLVFGQMVQFLHDGSNPKVVFYNLNFKDQYHRIRLNILS